MGTRPKRPGGEEQPDEDQAREGETAGEKDTAEGEVRKSARETPLPPLDKVGPSHVAYVRGLVSKFGVSPAYEYEDIVQEVLIQASRSLDSPLEPRALLFGITRHIVFRWLAKRDTDRTAVQTHLDESDTEDHVPDVEELWRVAERAHAVHAAIRDLPDIFRDVFVRCEIDEVPMPDVARELGIPINTGYTRLHLARERFQEALKRYMARKRIGKDDLAIPIMIGGGLGGAPPPPRLGLLGRAHILAANAILVSVAVSALWTAPLGPSPAPSSEPTALPEPPRPIPHPIVAPVESGTEQPPPARSDADVVIAPPARDDRVDPDDERCAVNLGSARPARAEGTWARQIVGLARDGKRADAAVQAAAFQRIYPRSTYRLQIESALRESSR